ncbi:MAG TPA: hypothetical protein VNL71_20965 [Chloroflexota bacterium]|nr:hypothetical protein [Chloroflexota bacterium]
MTIQPTIEDIAADVAQLKRENADLRARIETLHPGPSPRGWRRGLPAVFSIAIVVTGLLALTGSRAAAGAGSGPSVVHAPFSVVDASGNDVMTIRSDGTMTLWYQNKVFAGIKRNASGGGLLQLIDSNELGATTLETDADGGFLQIDDHNGRRRAVLGIDPKDRASFDILNAGGHVVIQLDETTTGGHLALANELSTSRVEAGVVGGDVGEVNAYGPTGTRFLKGK